MSVHPAELGLDDLLKTCQLTRTRRSGPGGQHRNKVETAIVVEHLPTGIQAEANEARSQEANRLRAIKRLRLKLALEIRQPERAEQLPSAAWQKRFPKGRLEINPEHDDFPGLLAEVLDILDSNQYEIKKSAVQLGCSGSQLTRFLKLDLQAWGQVNRVRQALGFHTLK
ncbi:MAG: peptide chain release factor-like protein [Planctomycetaceae bacterium]